MVGINISATVLQPPFWCENTSPLLVVKIKSSNLPVISQTVLKGFPTVSLSKDLKRIHCSVSAIPSLVTNINTCIQSCCVLYLLSVGADLDGIGNEAGSLLFRHRADVL